MTFAARLAAARRGGIDQEGLADLARLALEAGEEEVALPLVLKAAAQGVNASLWQWVGLLRRGLDDHAAALEALEQAARLAPLDASIAHGRAQVMLEAGLDAVAAFEAASRLGPPKGDVLVGLAAARWAMGHADEAIAGLDAVLAQAPFWLQGHAQLAQLRALSGQSPDVSLKRTIAAQPDQPALWRALFDLHVRQENFPELAAQVERARAAGVPAVHLDAHAAIAAAEAGETQKADRLFATLPETISAELAVWRIRHLLRSGRLESALPLIEAEIAAGGARAAAAWPYAAAGWRMAGEPRHAWLEGDPRLVAVIDLADRLPPLNRLAEVLGRLHIARGQYLDQSVRGGTQTDGPLFSRIDPDIRAMRAAVVAAVADYIAALPPRDPTHPLLAPRRDRRIRFSGSWSVRLGGGGHHSNHVHPQGWISSALYIALPERDEAEPAAAGWLTLGEPQAALRLALPPTRLIEPKPGHLVLFPSWMWHGTRPFVHGNRLTVAFDVAHSH